MKPEKPKVVLDTNIIVSAAISSDGNPATVFELLLENKIINYTTKEIINEVKEVLERPFFNIDKEFKKFILENYKRNSILVLPKFFENIIEKDSKDDKFVNCALSAKANIISGDRHLLEVGNYKWVKILTPKEFLDDLNNNV